MDALLPLLRHVEYAVPDAELLDRFDRARDEGAFTELVRRHGPVVYRICYGLVGASGADDAFQATFLILATRLGAARASGALAGWLTGVAGRVARQMRRGAGRRIHHETAAGANQPRAATDRTADRCDQFCALDEELTRLPSALRDPVVLCLVQDYTQDRAAAALGCDPRTVRRRLERAKSVLRERLERRGVTPAVAVALVTGAGGPATAVPVELGQRTVALVLDFLAGRGAAHASATLARQFAIAAFAQKALGYAAAAVALVAIGAALVATGRSVGDEPATAAASHALTPSAPPPVDEAEARAVALVERLGGTVTRDETRPGKPVTGVNLSGTAVTNADLKELTVLRHLTALDLSSTKVNNAGMTELAAFKVLARLNLACARLTSTGLKPVCALQTLTHLNLSGLSVTRDRLKELGALPHLVELDLSQTPITDAEVKELAALKGLTALNLQYTQITDAGVKELTALRNLTELDLSYTKLTDAGVRGLTALTKLTRLRLNRTEVGNAGCKSLAAFTGLTHLELFLTQITDAGAKELTALNNLTHLYVSGPRLTEAGGRELAALKSLTALSLGVPLSDDGLKALATLPNLTMLSFNATGATAAGLRELRALKRLTTLTISCDLLSDACVKELAGLTGLTRLHLYNMRTPSDTVQFSRIMELFQTDQHTPTDAGINELRALKNLVELTLSDVNLTDAGLRSIATLPKLTRLTLSVKRVTNAGLADLATVTGLTDLTLQHTAITDAGLQELEPLINLRTLHLFRTAITSSGQEDLQKTLPKCKITRMAE